MGFGFGFGFSAAIGSGGEAGAYTFTNAEAAALVARFTAPPPASRKALIDTFVGALKTAGVWAKLDFLHVMAAHDAQAARQNWIADAFHASVASGPVFTADRGYQTDGLASYVETNFNPSTAVGKFTRDSAVFGAWNLTDEAWGASLASSAGWFDGVDGVTILFRNLSDLSGGRINQAAGVTGTTAVSTGIVAVDRSGPSETAVYQNGSSIAAGAGASTELNDATFSYGRVTATGFSERQFAMGFAGQSLSSGEHAALYAAGLAYMQGVGAA